MDKVDRWAPEIKHVSSPGPGRLGTDAVELHIEHGVGMIVEQDRGHIKALACHRPPRLECVEGASVGLEGKDGSAGGGDCSSYCDGQSLSDGSTGEAEPVVGRSSGGSRRGPDPRCVPFIGHDGALGHQGTQRLAHRLGVKRPRGERRRASLLTRCQTSTNVDQRGQGRHGGAQIVRWVGYRVHGTAIGDQITWLPGVGEEGHGRCGVDQDQVPGSVELHGGKLGEICQPLHRRTPRTSFQSGRKCLAQELGPSGGGDVRHPAENRFGAGTTANQYGGRLFGAQSRCGNGHGWFVRSGPTHRWSGRVGPGSHHTSLRPRDVGRNNKGCHRGGRSLGGGQGVNCVRTQLGHSLGRADERRHVASDGLDVRLELPRHTAGAK